MNSTVLTDMRKKRILAGCTFLILALAMISESLAVIQTPMLEKLGATAYFSLVAIIGSIGTAIFTPIGGKLGDLFGRRNVILFAGIAAIAANLVVALSDSFAPFLIGRFVMGSALGAYISTPYVLANELNAKENVPRMMGILASAMSLGGLLGGYCAGVLWKSGQQFLSIAFPSFFLLIGVLLVALNLPNRKKEGKVALDKAGILVLSIALTAGLVGINMATRNGFGDTKALALLAIGIVATVVFVQVEKKAQEPLIPMHLFKNRQYCSMLLVGFIAYFYVSSMRVYGPRAVIGVLGMETSVAGQLQIPRTLITIVLSALAGVWVGKKQANRWKAMAIATLLVAIPFLVLSTTTPSTPLWLYLAMFGVTGIAESFRSVSVTPSAQAVLEPKEIGVGTALVNFMNTLAFPIASSLFGIAYDLPTSSDPTNAALINQGINNVFLTSGIIALIGFIFVLLVVRKFFRKEA